MIANERQFRITRAQHAKLLEAIRGFDLNAVSRRVGSEILAKAQLDALQSEAESLDAQLQEYSALVSGRVRVLQAQGLAELPQVLIQARIARGLSQRELAEKLGMKEQQIQRYEAEGYAQASLGRLYEVASALGLDIKQTVQLQ